MLDKLSVLYSKMVAEKMMTFQTAAGKSHLLTDKLLIIEALNLLSRIDTNYADAKRANLSDLSYYIKDVPQLIVDCRSYMNTKPLTRPRGRDNISFNTEDEPQFQGQGRGG